MALGQSLNILTDGITPDVLIEGCGTEKLVNSVLSDLLREENSPGTRGGGMPLVSLMGDRKPGAWDED